MQRSIGVTISAVVVFAGCAVFLLLAVLIAFTTQMAPAALAVPFMKGVLIAEIVVDLAFVGWGVSAGIGLIRLEPWARTSMLVFSAIMAFFCAVPMIVFPFISIPQPAAAPPNLVHVVRVFVESFYAVFLALAAFWIYFFNRKSVKEQFARAASVHAAEMATQTGVLPETGSKRPVPILVLGIFLIVSGACAPFVLMLHTPVLLFGSVIVGTTAKVALIVLSVLNLLAGVGLVKMRAWGWALALFLQAVNLVNVACFLLIPNAAEKLQDAMGQMYGQMGLEMPTGFLSENLMRVGYGCGLLLAVGIVWVLMAYRKAFEASAAQIA
jgi:hypothetical protein